MQSFIIKIIVYQIPAAFSASWIPYKAILALFEAGYVYPTITLLVMWEVTFFLESIEVLSVPYSEIKKDETVEIEKVETSIPAIDEECQKTFSDYYAKSPEIVPNTEQNYSEHSHFTNIITDAIRNDI